VNGLEKVEVELRQKKKEKEKGTEIDQSEIERLEEEFKEIDNNPEHPERKKEYHIKGKHIKLYRKAEYASITGDTVGDPMKDTSGPSLNILIKLSSIISVVFGTFFVQTAYLVNN
jgi:hypothetical protein